MSVAFLIMVMSRRGPNYSPPKLCADALAQRGLGRSVHSRTVPINKERFASIYKESLRGTLNRPPRRCAAPLLTKEYHQPPGGRPKNSKKVGALALIQNKALTRLPS